MIKCIYWCGKTITPKPIFHPNGILKRSSWRSH